MDNNLSPSIELGAQAIHRKGEITNELEVLAQSMVDLRSRVGTLVDRLSPILRNDPEVSADKVLEPVGPPITSTIALSIRQVSEEHASLIRMISYVTSRLEI